MLVIFYICLIISAKIVKLNGYETTLDYDMHAKALDPEICEKQLNSLREPIGNMFAELNANVPRSVFLRSRTKFIGNFDKCLSVAGKVSGASLVGKYCRVHADLPNPFQFDVTNETRTQYELDSQRRKAFKMYLETGCEGFASSSPNRIQVNIDMCMPAACGVETAMAWVFNEHNNITFDGELVPGVRYAESFCRIGGDKPFSMAEAVAIVVFSVILLLTFLSTAYEIYRKLKDEKSKPNPKYSSFSIYSNTRRLISCRSSSGTIECADGMRAISLIFVVMFHEAVMTHRDNLFLAPRFAWNDFEHITSAGTNAVDTFFVLSGLFLVYTTVGTINRASFFKNLHHFYVRRLLRLWPLMAASVLIASSFLARVADGPSWAEVAQAVDGCRLNWWPILSFIQNQVKFCEANTAVCLPHFWYISVDMQLYIMSPLLLMWLFGQRRTAWMALVSAAVLCVALSAAFSFVFNFTYEGNNPDVYASLQDKVLYEREFNTQYYQNPLARAAPFVIGMMAGYVLHCSRKLKLQISKACLVICWSISLAIIVIVIGGKKPFQKTVVNQTLHNVMNGFSRTLWGLAVAWIVVACHNGNGGPVNWFLSLRMWKLPSRVSYAMYLVHFTIISMNKGVETQADVDAHTSISSAPWLFTQTFVVALVLTVVIEAPVQNLQKIYFRVKRANVEKKEVFKQNLDADVRKKKETNEQIKATKL